MVQVFEQHFKGILFALFQVNRPGDVLIFKSKQAYNQSRGLATMGLKPQGLDNPPGI